MQEKRITEHHYREREAGCWGYLCLNLIIRLVVDLLVTTMLPLTLSPIVLEILTVGVLTGRGVHQGLLKTSLAALAQAEEHDARNANRSSCGCANVDSNVSSLAEIVPLL